MGDLTSVKVPKALHAEIQRRADRLGMTKGDYVERLLTMALELHKGDAVEEFAALLPYAKEK